MQFSTIFATLAVSAAAAIPTFDHSKLFGLQAIHSGNADVHLRSVTVSGARYEDGKLVSGTLGLTKDRPVEAVFQQGSFLVIDGGRVFQDGSALVVDAANSTSGFAVDNAQDLTLQGASSFVACPGADGDFTLQVSSGAGDCDGAVGVALHAVQQQS